MNQDNDTPIDDLPELESEVSPAFLRAVRNKIYRRTATNQVFAFSWNLPKVILLEMLKLIAHFLTGGREEKTKQ